MSQSEAIERGLHAYHDDELGWFARVRFERRLSRSAELREELESLRRLQALTAESEADMTLAHGAIWEGIEGRLRAVDVQLSADSAAAAESPLPAWLSWRPMGAAALAAAGALGLALFLQPSPQPVPGVGEAIPSGTVRYLDTGGRSVVVHDRDDVTIIWVMGAGDV